MHDSLRCVTSQAHRMIEYISEKNVDQLAVVRSSTGVKVAVTESLFMESIPRGFCRR